METLREFWSTFYSQNSATLSEHYPGLNIERFMMEVRDCSQVDLEDSVYSMSEKQINKMKGTFLKGIPFAYLLGKSEFYNHEYFVNSHVLIPRPETEYLVDIIVNEFKNKSERVLDVGTGSGVILLSLLSHGVGKSGVGVDISLEALKVAKINGDRLRLGAIASFIQSDRLKNVTGTFDLIVSNPPYIKASSHRKLVHAGVDAHEPHEALYLPDDFYNMWFEDFFQEIRSHLKGTFFMEGHELEVEDQAKILTKLGFQKIQVLNDMTGSKRFLKATSGI